MAPTPKTKAAAKPPAAATIAAKALGFAFGVLEIAGKRLAKLAHQGKKKVSAGTSTKQRAA